MKCEQYCILVVCRQLPRFARNSLLLEGGMHLGGESTFENCPDLIINLIYYFYQTTPDNYHFFLFKNIIECFWTLVHNVGYFMLLLL